MSDGSEDVRFVVEAGVATVTLNRPATLNAMTWGMAGRLVDLLTEINERDDIPAAVLTGAGRAFCAGGDLSQQAPPMNRRRRKLSIGDYARLSLALRDVEKPLIAAVNGPAIGSGLAYALACDRRFGDPAARFSAIWAARGMHPDAGISWLLPRVVRLPEALRLVCTGEMIDASEALRIGLIDEITAPGGALEAAFAYAQRLAKGASVAIDLARRAILAGAAGADLETMLRQEAAGAAVVAQTFDRKEGVVAFLKQREPQFRGE